MSVKFMLLGALAENPIHGYELKTRFFSRLFADFGINDGQLYPALNRMEKDGLVRKEIVTREGAPSRHKYFITDAGRRELVAWLEDAEGEDRSFRYEFVRKDTFFLKCNFIKHLDKKKAVAKMRAQIDVIRATIDDFEQARERMIEKKIDPMRVKILEYGISNQRARLEWLTGFAAELEKTPARRSAKSKNGSGKK